MAKNKALNLIRQNIEESGFHIYYVDGGPSPRFLYTIGLSEKIGFELVLAGSAYFDEEEASNIISECAEKCLVDAELSKIKLKNGRSSFSFSLREIDGSWRDLMLLGATDYYKSNEIRAKQIVPESNFMTIDVPDMSIPWSLDSNPVWSWLEVDWKYSIPEDSTAVTNVDALQGKPLTEIVRWEDNTWAIFSGAGRSQSKVREVPLAIFLSNDPSLILVADMEEDAGLWRNPSESEWRDWK